MGQRGLLVVAGLTFLDLFLPWQRPCADVAGVRTCAAEAGWAGIGIVLGLVVVALLAWESLRIAGVDLGTEVEPTRVSAALATVSVLLTVLKVSLDGEALALGAWLGLALAAAMAYTAWLRYQEGRVAPGRHLG